MKAFDAARLGKTRLALGLLAVAGLALAVMFGTDGLVLAQARGGALTGSVTADRGEVRALRVRARDTVGRILYTVYTRGGKYQIGNLPASTYEVSVLEETFESPVQTVEVKAGATATADIAIKAKADWKEATPPLEYVAVNRAKNPQLEFLEYDALYPPHPTRDLMYKNGCFNCHSGGAYIGNTFHRMGPRDETTWRRGVEKMFNMNQGRVGKNAEGIYEEVTSPVQSHERVSAAETEQIVQYLTANFGPNYKRKDLKLDPLVRDEAALAGAIYVQYELSRTHGPAYANGARPQPSGHTAIESETTPGVWWVSGLSNSSLMRVNTKDLNFTTRTKETLTPHPANINTSAHGIVEVKNKVWMVEMSGNRLIEYDPKTDKVEAHFIPTKGGSPHDPWPDAEGNLWYTMWSTTGKIGKFNTSTKEFKDYEVSKGWAGYGLVTDKQDRKWFVGLNTPAVVMHDPKTDKLTTFPITLPARRVTLDSKGNVWMCSYEGNLIMMLDPKTGKVTNHYLSLKNGHPYALWMGPNDVLWIENSTYNSMVKFDLKTQKFTYFPFPDLNAHTFNMHNGKDGSLGFTLGSPTKLTLFKEKGEVNGTTSAK